MTAKQIKKISKQLNSAMLILQDARDNIIVTDDSSLEEHFKAQQQYHNLTHSISNLHYVMASLEE